MPISTFPVTFPGTQKYDIKLLSMYLYVCVCVCQANGGRVDRECKNVPELIESVAAIFEVTLGCYRVTRRGSVWEVGMTSVETEDSFLATENKNKTR